MTTNDPSPKEESFTLGFALGFIGGMALYYLSNPEASHHLKTKLLEIYNAALEGSDEAKDELMAYAHQAKQAYLTPGDTDPVAPVPSSFDFTTTPNQSTLELLKSEWQRWIPKAKTATGKTKASSGKKSPNRKYFTSHR
jgi:hypothetical protein